MKKTIFFVFFALTISLCFAEENWSELSSEKAVVTIYYPDGIKINAQKTIIYDQKELAEFQRGNYLDLEIPVGENIFFIKNGYFLDMEDRFCFFEAELNAHYYIKIELLFGGATSLILMDSDNATKELEGLSQIEVGEKL